MRKLSEDLAQKNELVQKLQKEKEHLVELSQVSAAEMTWDHILCVHLFMFQNPSLRPIALDRCCTVLTGGFQGCCSVKVSHEAR